MTFTASSLQSLSLDEASFSTLPKDKPPTESLPSTKPRRPSRPGQVNSSPLPPMDEWLRVKAAKQGMYYGLYANEDMLQGVLASRWLKLWDRKFNDMFLYPALLYLRSRYGHNDIPLNVGILPQRAKDLNPSIVAAVGEHVLVLCLFELGEESLVDRMTQKAVDEIGKMMGMKPTWWHVTYLMTTVCICGLHMVSYVDTHAYTSSGLHGWHTSSLTS